MSTERKRAADDVQVANRRLDASENEALIGMTRMGAGAFGYTADRRIDPGLAQLQQAEPGTCEWHDGETVLTVLLAGHRQIACVLSRS